MQNINLPEASDVRGETFSAVEGRELRTFFIFESFSELHQNKCNQEHEPEGNKFWILLTKI